MKNKPIKATDGSGAKTARAETPPVWSVVATLLSTTFLRFLSRQHESVPKYVSKRFALLSSKILLVWYLHNLFPKSHRGPPPEYLIGLALQEISHWTGASLFHRCSFPANPESLPILRS